jgi:CRISPR-associated protein (Cas_Csm6)
MASIILSFVGNQDPFSGDTNQEGSIVSLVKHLVLEKDRKIKQVFLLATDGTLAGAKDTQEWLHSEFNLAIESIELIQVDEALSQDPIDILLATNAAKEVLTRAKKLVSQGDILEFNASSGTPAMKSTWSILQSAGYAPHSRVWQVRNPKQIQPGQERVFATDLSVLKREFDLSIVKQQLADYNYSGALATIKDSDLNSDVVTALLNYGHRRLSFDFDRAHQSINKFTGQYKLNYLFESIENLCNKNYVSLLEEIYFTTQISLKNEQYCDFLISVSQFQENIFRLLLFKIGLEVPDELDRMYVFWSELKVIDGGKLHQKLINNTNMEMTGKLDTPKIINIIRSHGQYKDLLKDIEKLRSFCVRRNKYIHRMEGVSYINDAENVLNDIKDILNQVTKIPGTNPFDRLNQDILSQLATTTRST